MWTIALTSAQEDSVRLRLSVISCILTVADMMFCASSFLSRPTYFWQSRSVHSFMLITLSLSWAYCFGVNVVFWWQLLQRWRRQNLTLTI